MTGGMLTELERDSRKLRMANLYKDPTYEWDSYEKDDERVKFYTGLPNFAVLSLVFSIVADYLNPLRLVATKQQQLLIVLVKLRMNYLFTDMAYRLNIHNATVHRIFHETLNVLYYRLAFLVKWPDRDAMRKSMPYCFQEAFGNKVAVIVDCFELFTEKPGGAKDQLVTYSNYKSHTTAKYLIGISPQGVITSISDGYGGRTPDKWITNESKILQNLLPGDVIMADRGFRIHDEVSFYQAKLAIPSFTKGKLQMHPLDIDNSRKVAHVRIHVERVIGLLLRKFRCFDCNIPIEFLKTRCSKPTLDKIVLVCSAITNLNTSVVPFQ